MMKHEPQIDMRSKHVMDFYIAGFTYWEGIFVAQQLKVCDRLELRLECDNPYDPNAVALYYQGNKLGYIPRIYNTEISQLLYFGHENFETIISQIDLEKHPERQVRVAIRLRDVRVD